MVIEKGNAAAVAERFYDFYDGVVLDVRLEIRPRRCTLRMECHDRLSKTGWSHITVTVTDVSRFRFEYGRTSFEVLSGGAQFVWSEGLVYVVLDAYPDDGPGLPDLSTNIAFVAGVACELDAAPVAGT